MTAEFDRQWKAMHLDDNDLNRLQQEILNNPKIGSVIRGTGRLRKCGLPLREREKVEAQGLLMWILLSMIQFI